MLVPLYARFALVRQRIIQLMRMKCNILQPVKRWLRCEIRIHSRPSAAVRCRSPDLYRKNSISHCISV